MTAPRPTAMHERSNFSANSAVIPASSGMSWRRIFRLPPLRPPVAVSSSDAPLSAAVVELRNRDRRFGECVNGTSAAINLVRLHGRVAWDLTEARASVGHRHQRKLAREKENQEPLNSTIKSRLWICIEICSDPVNWTTSDTNICILHLIIILSYFRGINHSVTLRNRDGQFSLIVDTQFDREWEDSDFHPSSDQTIIAN